MAVLAVNALLVWQLEYIRAMGLMRIGQHVLLDLRMTIFRHLQRLSLSYYDRTKQGWIISRVTSDLGVLEDILTWTIPQIASVVFLILGGTVWMLLCSPMLFWVLLGAVPLMVVVTFVFHGYIAEAWREVRLQVSRICANLAENIAGVRVDGDKLTIPWSFKVFGLGIRFTDAILFFTPFLFFGYQYPIWILALLALSVAVVLFFSIRLVLMKQFDRGRIRILPVFKLIREMAGVPDDDMLRTFNLGVGMTLVVAPSAVDGVIRHLAAKGHASYLIGEIVPGERKVAYLGALAW
jgi:hypothetical protein